MRQNLTLFIFTLLLLMAPLKGYAQSTTGTDAGTDTPATATPATPPQLLREYINQCKKLLRQVNKEQKNVISKDSKYNSAVARRNREAQVSAQKIVSNQITTQQKKQARTQSTDAKKDQIDNQIHALQQQKDSCVNFLFWQCSYYHKQKDYQIQTKKNQKEQLDANDQAYFAQLDEKQRKFVQNQNARIARYDEKVTDRLADLQEAIRLYDLSLAYYNGANCPAIMAEPIT